MINTPYFSSLAITPKMANCKSHFIFKIRVQKKQIECTIISSSKSNELEKLNPKGKVDYHGEWVSCKNVYKEQKRIHESLKDDRCPVATR